MTSTFRALLPLAEDLSTASFAEGDARASSTRARIEFLRLAIIRNRDVAKSCDADFRNQLLILANEMEDHLRVLVVTLPESRAE